jgi:hypothetical protein
VHPGPAQAVAHGGRAPRPLTILPSSGVVARLDGQDVAVNFVGHIATGLRVGGHPVDPAFLVGTALPDFAAMGRARLGTAEGSLGGGIALHHATDHAFHAEGWFLGLERELRELFRKDGLPDGAARACAHVGPELLLDGALIDDSAIASGVRTVYAQIAAPEADVVDLVPSCKHDQWCAHLMCVATRLDPCTYGDTAIVAQRLHGITSRRPRLAFDEELLGAVRARMVAVQPRIAASATDVLDRVVEAVEGTRPRHRFKFRR